MVGKRYFGGVRMTKIQKISDVTTITSGDKNYDLIGVDPKILVEATLAACATKTMREVLERDGIEYNEEDVSAEVEGTLSEEGVKRFSHFDLKLTYPTLPDGYDEEKFLTTVERGCIIGNTLKNEATVDFKKA